jgi:hypothetical protein
MAVKATRLGKHLVTTAGEMVKALVPTPLPPVPSIQMDSLHRPLEAANHAIGRLDGVTSVLPDTPPRRQPHTRTLHTEVLY